MEKLCARANERTRTTKRSQAPKDGVMEYRQGKELRAHSAAKAVMRRVMTTQGIQRDSTPAIQTHTHTRNATARLFVCQLGRALYFGSATVLKDDVAAGSGQLAQRESNASRG